MGAMHGLGRSTLSSISELPSMSAMNKPVSTLTMTALPSPSLDTQLTIALKKGIGLIPAPQGVDSRVVGIEHQALYLYFDISVGFQLTHRLSDDPG